MLEPGEKRVYDTYLILWMQQENQKFKMEEPNFWFFFNVYFFYGAPGGSRTHDLRLRRPTLYPAELRAQTNFGLRISKFGAGSS